MCMVEESSHAPSQEVHAFQFPLFLSHGTHCATEVGGALFDIFRIHYSGVTSDLGTIRCH